MLKFLLIDRRGGIDEIYSDFRNETLIIPILEKRIEVYELPSVEKSALLMLTLLSQGNVGRAILGLIETYEAYEAYEPNKPEKINIDFICSTVYPDGIYTDQSFFDNFETRKQLRDFGYNRII